MSLAKVWECDLCRNDYAAPVEATMSMPNHWAKHVITVGPMCVSTEELHMCPDCDSAFDKFKRARRNGE